MKKLGILFLAVLLSVLAVSVFAETAEVQVINWETDMLPQLGDQIELGDFYDYEIFNMKMWVPKFLTQLEVTEDEKKMGYVDKFASEDGKRALAVYAADIGKDFETYYKDLLQDSDVANVKLAEVNGLHAILYQKVSLDWQIFSFTAGGNNVVELYFLPASDAEYAPFMQITASSVQKLGE